MEKLYTVNDLLEIYGTTQPNLSRLLAHRPLPHYAILLDTKKSAWSLEQAEWFTESRRKNTDKSLWSTPWDGTRPKEYWSRQTLAKKLGITYSSVKSLLKYHPLEPACYTSFGKRGNFIPWYDPKDAAKWVKERKEKPRAATVLAEYKKPLYLSRGAVAKKLGVSRDTVRDYDLPEHDAEIDTGGKLIPVWYESTIVAWDETRDHKRKR